jgi:hypothetical protein
MVRLVTLGGPSHSTAALVRVPNVRGATVALRRSAFAGVADTANLSAHFHLLKVSKWRTLLRLGLHHVRNFPHRHQLASIVAVRREAVRFDDLLHFRCLRHVNFQRRKPRSKVVSARSHLHKNWPRSALGHVRPPPLSTTCCTSVPTIHNLLHVGAHYSMFSAPARQHERCDCAKHSERKSRPKFQYHPTSAGTRNKRRKKVQSQN